MSLPVCLSIAGSDSGAGAGVQADLLTFSAFGVYGINAITCITAQNPVEVAKVEVLSADIVRDQIVSLRKYYQLSAVKIGMLMSEENVLAVSESIESLDVPIVLDPVMVSTSGRRLLEEKALDLLTEKLFSRVRLVTPNLEEVAVLLGAVPKSEDDMVESSRELVGRHGTAFLLKGGHLEGSQLVDVLLEPGSDPILFRAEKVADVNTHGTGCTYSSAITASLAKGDSLADSCRKGHAYLQKCIRNPLLVGGQPFMNHAAFQ